MEGCRDGGEEAEAAKEDAALRAISRSCVILSCAREYIEFDVLGRGAGSACGNDTERGGE